MDRPSRAVGVRRPLYVVALTFLAPAAFAVPGDYHEGSTLDCAECHVLHPQPIAGLSGGLSQRVGPLLKKDVNDLCLSCHDDSARAPDVLGRNGGKYPSDIREAGYLNRLGVSGQPSTGHTLDSLDPAPGSNPPWSAADESHGGRGLDCTHCHAAHGGEHGRHPYRNLRDDAGNNRPGQGYVSYNTGLAGTNDLSKDVFVRASLRYDESSVDFNEPDRDDSAMARFCAGCHGEFHGRVGDPGTIGGERGPGGRYRGFVRHPAAGVNLALRADGESGSSAMLYNQHANKVKVMSSSGVWSPVGGDATPTCVTCHKAHGNGNAFGLIYRSGQGRLTEDGDSKGSQVEHLCGQCHQEASSFARL